MQTYTKIVIPCTTFFNFFVCFVEKIFVSLFAATCLGNTLFMDTKKDKRYACLLYCISTTLSFKFLFMFSSPFQGSLKFFFTYEQWIYVYFYLFFSLFVSFRLKVCRLLPLPSSESVGRTLLIACYRSLSPTYPLQPLLQIGWSSSSCSSF